VIRLSLPYITLHGLRHTFATNALQAGVPIKVVSERLGHSSVAFTLAQYVHVMKGTDKDAAALMGALFTTPPELDPNDGQPDLDDEQSG
jgi:integrase